MSAAAHPQTGVSIRKSVAPSMTSEDAPEPNSTDAKFERFLRCFESHIPLVARLHLASSARTELPWTAICPLLYSILDSADSFRHLVRHNKVRDGYVVARTIYETVVNVCFLLASDSEIAERAWRHAKQKAVRDLDRTIEVGDQAITIRWSGADEIGADPDVQQLLSEFTSSKGREVRDWTQESVPQRIDVVRKRFGRRLSNGLVFGLILYRHSSEVAHGTLFGALFALGALEPLGPPRSDSELVQRGRDHCVRLLLLLDVSLNSLVEITASMLRMNRLASESRSFLNAALDRTTGSDA